MSKTKLNSNDLEKVCGGALYFFVKNVELEEPIAIVNNFIFNTNDYNQIRCIVRGNPSFEAIQELSDDIVEGIPKYSLRHLRHWFKHIPVPYLYRHSSPAITSPTPPIPETFNAI